MSNHSGQPTLSEMEDIETGEQSPSGSVSPDSRKGANASDKSTTNSQHFSIAFLTQDFRGKKSKWAKLFPWFAPKNDYQSRFHQSVLGTASQSVSTSSFGQRLCCTWFSERTRLRDEFQSEMRILARLRHPCITTVMGKYFWMLICSVQWGKKTHFCSLTANCRRCCHKDSRSNVGNGVHGIRKSPWYPSKRYHWSWWRNDFANLSRCKCFSVVCCLTMALIQHKELIQTQSLHSSLPKVYDTCIPPSLQ